MSGIEVAGLVLGAFPLVVESFKFYLEGVSTIKDYFSSIWNLRRLIGRIETEEKVFLNACEGLLDGLIPPQRARLLMEDKTGEAWARADIQRSLRRRLGAALESYIDTLKRVHEALRMVAKKLDLNNEWKVKFDDVSSFRKEYRKIRFTLKKKDYDDLLEDIKGDVSQLRHLTTSSKELEPSRRLSSGPDLDIFRSCARSVHSVVSSSWKCTCRPQHSVNLLLDVKESEDDGDEQLQAKSSFDVIFCFDHTHKPMKGKSATVLWTWSQTRFRSAPSHENSIKLLPKPAGNATTSTFVNTRRGKAKSVRFNQPQQNSMPGPVTIKPIEDLCQAMADLQSQPHGQVSYIGSLMDPVNSQEHRLYSAEDQPSFWSTITLDDVLSQKSRFPSKKRLQLGKTLASSILQLGQTPWLSDHWNKRDISFVDHPGGADFERPFISASLRGNATIPGTQYRNDGIIRNEGLFTLGILLIELWFGATVQEVCKAARLDSVLVYGNGDTSAGIDWIAMDKLLQHVQDESLEEYSDAVRICIRCDIPCREKSFEVGEFQDAVYTYIVHPLWLLRRNAL